MNNLLSENDAKDAIIADLTSLLEQVIQYLREHVKAEYSLRDIEHEYSLTDIDHESMLGYIDHEFLLRFADTCQQVLDDNTVPRIQSRYHLLRDLYHEIRPYLNALCHGHHDKFWITLMKEKVAQIWFEQHGNYKGLAWRSDEVT